MRAMVRSIQVSDFGPFQGSRTFEFDGPGTYAICAKNGSGKSHILLGVKITSSPSCALDKPLSAYVNGMGRGAKSAQIGVDYVVGGETLSVQRTIALSKIPDEDELADMLGRNELLKANGRWKVEYRGDTIKSASDAEELLRSLFALDNRTQEDSVFVMQNQAGQIISSTPAVRSKDLQFLCGAETCQKAADIAQRKLGLLHVDDRSEELALKVEQHKNLAEQCTALEAEIATLQSAMVDESRIQKLRTALAESDAAKAKSAVYPAARARLDELRTKLAENQAALTKFEMELATYTEERNNRSVAVEEARVFVQSHKANAELAKQRAAAFDLVDQLAAEPDSHPQPAVPSTPREKLSELDEIISDLELSVSNANNFLKIFAATGMCPTCGSKPQDVDKLVERNKQVVSENSPLLKEARSTKAAVELAWKTYDKALASHTAWHEGWLKRVDEASARLDQFADVPATDAEVLDQNIAMVKEFDNVLKRITEIENAIHGFEREISGLQVSVASQEVKVNEIEAEMKQVMAPEKYASMAEAIKANDTTRQELAEKSGMFTAKVDQLGALAQEIEDLESSQAKIARKVKAREFLEGIKTVMHHSAIPHDRSIVYLESINSLMRDYCEIIHAPFTLYVDPDTQHFMCLTDNGVMPAYQLSGGQSTLAAWAWHLALYEKHGSQVGFLFMDEPTVGLDDANLANVGEAVRHLTKHCHGAGMQFVIVTHEAGLASVFDRVIYL